MNLKIKLFCSQIQHLLHKQKIIQLSQKRIFRGEEYANLERPFFKIHLKIATRILLLFFFFSVEFYDDFRATKNVDSGTYILEVLL